MTKQFRITVNGNQYEVEVEELKEGSGQTEGETNTIPRTSSPQPAKKSSPSPAEKSTNKQKQTRSKETSSAGSGQVRAPMAGKVIEIDKSEGEKVNKGETILKLEAMKMENEIVSPQTGVIDNIHVSTDQNVESDELLLEIK